MKTTSLAALILLSSGCTNVMDNLYPASAPKVDNSIEIVNYNSINLFLIWQMLALNGKK